MGALKELVIRYGETVLVPIGLTIIYVMFIITADAQGASLIVAIGFFLFVMFLWFTFRRLKLHASASRLAGVGDPDALLALVARESPRMLTEGARRPLHVHAAIAHNLRGDFAAARRELDISGLLAPRQGRLSRGWIALAAATDVTTRSEQGDLAGARASYERGVVPFVALAPFGGMELVARECEARLRLLEGDAAGARERLAPLTKNIRLGDATRAQVHALLARAAAMVGETAAVAEHAAKARALAPKCKLLPDGIAGAEPGGATPDRAA